uniref:Nucleotidyl transferase AbiEii/AbiGii toxin family protein n=1 Tax=candidate division WWE3 bacterium TaxID=2053526 RepID=A0A7C4XMP6_UNCKA
MGKVPELFVPTVCLLAQKLNRGLYAIRGTASLVLQGLDFNVSDIDVICDKDTALLCNVLLNEFVVSPVIYSESSKFKSYFGKFKVNGLDVEIYGDWQIKDSKGEWSKVFDGNERKELSLNNTSTYVTTIDSELFMYMFMQRWNVYHKIKRELEQLNSPQLGLF